MLEKCTVIPPKVWWLLFSTFLADAQRSIVLEILWTGDQIGLFLNGLGYRENFLTKVAQISNDLGSSFIKCYNLN